MTAPSYAAAPLLDRDPVITRLYHAWEQASEGSAEEQAAEVALGAALGLEVEAVDFGVTDDKGRRVGGRVATWQGDGAYFAHARATRRREPYGASQPVREFGTPDERAAWVARYLASARRRAAKHGGHGRR